ncbi:MAG: type I-E CRISPR-associated protein Cse2/CasB [Candidatus Brocadiia bacterium]
MSQSPVVEADDATDATLPSVVGKLAVAIRDQLGSGEVAELRRISPHEPYTPALWKLLLTYVPDGWTTGPQRDEKERRWAALLMGMAITAGLHDHSVPLGRALAEAGWSELRFVRLMRDEGDSLMERVRRLAQYLASKAQPADWTDVAHILLDQQGDWAERHRMRIARDYYRTLYQQESRQSD